MKKVLVFIIVFLLLVPACLAETDESQYVGTWVYQEETTNGGFVLEVLHLSEAHKVFYIRQFYDDKAPTYNWKSVGFWQLTDNGLIIDTGEGYPEYYNAKQPSIYLGLLYLYYPAGNEYRIFEAISSDLMTRMADEMLENYTPETGVRVPMGHWHVGDDIPAGTYSIRLPNEENSSVYICIWGYEVDNYLSNGGLIFHETIKKSNSSIGKIELKDGWIVDIDGPVLFDEPIKLGF